MAKIVTETKVYTPNPALNNKSHYNDYVILNKQYFGDHPCTLAEEYNNIPKKPKRLARWIRNIIIICAISFSILLTTSIGMVFSGIIASDFTEKGRSNIHNFVSLAVNPNFNKNTELENYDYVSDPIGFTEFAYNTCSFNSKNTPFMTAYNSGLLYSQIGNTDNYIDIDAVILKTQEEYFNITYRLKNSVPILDSMIGPVIIKTTDIVTTERWYAHKGDSTVAYQKVKNNGYNANGIPYADWASFINVPAQTNYKPIITFNSEQNGIYKLIAHNVNKNTITKASVTHNNKEGYYTVSLTLDPTLEETVKDSIDDIRTGTGDKKAHYTLLTIEFTMWDSGYFRTFDMTEKWSANVLMSLNFDLKSAWEFSYNPSDCNFEEYKDALDMKNSLSTSKIFGYIRSTAKR